MKIAVATFAVALLASASALPFSEKTALVSEPDFTIKTEYRDLINIYRTTPFVDRSPIVPIKPTPTTDAPGSSCDAKTVILANKVMLQGDDGYDASRMAQYARYLGTKASASAALHPTLLVQCND